MITPVYGIRSEANIVLNRPFVSKKIIKMFKGNYVQPRNRMKKRNMSLYGA
jgi:hypothetical protein